MKPWRFAAIAIVATLSLAGCDKTTKQTTQLTEHQRDSILATEPIPGASAIGGAMRAVDKEARRAAKMDTMVH